MPWVPRNKVLVPIDFSENSFAALDTALDLVAGPEGVHVLHVLPDLSPMEPGVIWESINDAGRALHAKEKLMERLADDRYAGVNAHVGFGDPGTAIAEFAADAKVDLIVMPSHGRTGIARLLIGSVTERVLRLSHCPVLVMRQ